MKPRLSTDSSKNDHQKNKLSSAYWSHNNDKNILKCNSVIHCKTVRWTVRYTERCKPFVMVEKKESLVSCHSRERDINESKIEKCITNCIGFGYHKSSLYDLCTTLKQNKTNNVLEWHEREF